MDLPNPTEKRICSLPWPRVAKQTQQRSPRCMWRSSDMLDSHAVLMESHTCGVSPISTQVHYYDNTKAHWENSCGAFLRSQGSSFCRHLESSNITVRVHPIWNSAFWSAPRHPTGQEYLPPKWRKNAIQSEAWLHICAVSIPKRWGQLEFWKKNRKNAATNEKS